MQTILGSGGAIGIPLAKELNNYTEHIRLVSRNPKRVNETDELFPVDVRDFSKVEKAIEGSEMVYVTIGFEYNINVWRKTWPSFMQAVIDGCKKHQAKLVFLDNVYMYSKSAIPHMTEDSLMHPPSKKGEIRKQLVDMIMNDVEKNNLNALIARSADFYGPFNKNSMLNMIADNLMKGKKGQTIGDLNHIHTPTYTLDVARAMALLGNTTDAYNQTWHVPTTKEKLTTMQWIELIAKELHVEPKVQTLPAWMIKVLGLFVPVMRELPEILYQNNQDYIFDSSKFEKRFGIAATAPEEGIRVMIENLKASDVKRQPGL